LTQGLDFVDVGLLICLSSPHTRNNNTTTLTSPTSTTTTTTSTTTAQQHQQLNIIRSRDGPSLVAMSHGHEVAVARASAAVTPSLDTCNP
jgi:hypothetical protein